MSRLFGNEPTLCHTNCRPNIVLRQSGRCFCVADTDFVFKLRKTRKTRKWRNLIFFMANRFLPILTELIRKRILFLTKRIQIETDLNAVETIASLQHCKNRFVLFLNLYSQNTEALRTVAFNKVKFSCVFWQRPECYAVAADST